MSSRVSTGRARGRPSTTSSNRDDGYLAEELANAKLLPRSEVLAIVESLTLAFLQKLSRGEDPNLVLVHLMTVFILCRVSHKTYHFCLFEGQSFWEERHLGCQWPCSSGSDEGCEEIVCQKWSGSGEICKE